MSDKRSRKLTLVAHCILNQNCRVHGLAQKPGAIPEIANLLIKSGIGIVQMPCPEITYDGAARLPQTKAQYDHPAFRRHCRKIAREIISPIQEYKKGGTELKVVIGVEGSPSCAVKTASRSEKSGIFMEELRSALDRLGIAVPFYEIAFDSLKVDAAKISKLLKS